MKRLVAFALAAVGASGCALNPVSGKRELALISEPQEIEMGRQGAASVAADIGLVADPDLQAYVNRIGQTVAARTERPQLAWEYHVVDDAAVNAFALPGGFVFITRGLLASMTDEAELASVLGHESGHVAARHSVQQMSRQQIASLGLAVGSALSPTVAKYGQAVGAGVGLLFLKYSRADETQADQLGFRYALADGYDTRQMIGVFQMLDRSEKLSGAGELPEWQATHPNPGNRIAAVQTLIAATTESFAAKRVGQSDYLGRMDGLVYGEDPRVGHLQGSLFVDPAHAVQLRLPSGWTAQGSRRGATAASPARDAALELSVADGTAAQASARFFAQDGLQSGTPSQRFIHGSRSFTSEFSAAGADGGPVRGVATFIEQGGSTWTVVGFAAADRYASYADVFGAATESFERLTDPAALAAQPLRVQVVRVPHAMSLEQFDAGLPSSIPLAELAMINGLDEHVQLRTGQSIKRVIGTPPVHVATPSSK